MTPAEAKQVIEVLAQGIDPASGEVLGKDSALNHPSVIRALFVAVQALEAAVRKEARNGAEKPANVGKPWSDEEDEQLTEAFGTGQAVAGLARAHGRSAGAIQSRLLRLGLVQVQKPGSSAPSAGA